MAIKGAYKLVQSIRPGFLRDVVDRLLDEFLDAMDPVYQEAVAQKRPAAEHLVANKGRLADALLGVTDRRAAKADSGAVRKAYEKLRSIAKPQVEAAAPRLAKMVERHAAPTA
jgi:Family of unknown function (DUF6918)